MLVRHYLEQGLSKAAIAERVGVSRGTLYYWLARGELAGDAESVRYPPRPTKLDPYQALIRERLATYPELTAVRLFEEVRAAGYPGSLTQLKVFVRQIRPRPEPEPVVRFETAPGPEFLRFAAHWGFRIRSCRPYRAQTKGKVERPVRYVRQSFLYGREFAGDADLSAQGLHWLEHTANVRVHRTTGELPLARFTRDERAILRPLAARPYQPLVLPPERPASVSAPLPVPQVAVEHRPLAAYAALAAGTP